MSKNYRAANNCYHEKFLQWHLLEIFNIKVLKFEKQKKKTTYDLKISFWEYSLITNKHNQKLTDMFNKRDVTVYFIC